MKHRIIAAVVAAWTLCAHAQDAVVVNATRFPEDVRRLPASATVIDAEEIRRSPARTLPELLATQSGITMRDLFGNNAATTSVDLRGYGATAAQNTLILLDGRRLNDFDLSGVQWSSIPLASIERIEILRGSGGVLYGDAASAGVINIVTRSPLKQGPYGEAFGRVGSYHTSEGQLFAALGTPSFGIQGSTYGFRSAGFRANNLNEQRNDTLGLRWALGEGALDLRVATDRQDLRLPGVRRIQPSTGRNEFATDPRGAQTPNDYSSRDGRRAGLSFVQRVGEAEVSFGLDTRDKDGRIYGDLFGFQTYRADTLEYRSFTPKIRLPFTLGPTKHRLTLGADLHDWEFRSLRTNRPENLGRPTNDARVAHRTRALYALDSVDFSPTTTGTLGYRTERARYAGRDTVDAATPGCVFGCSAAAPVDRSFREEAWELGLRQRLGSAWSVFGRASRSFRFATSEEVYELSPVTFTNQFDVLRPQRARTYEAGADWRAGAHHARAAVFTSDVSDEIHLNPLTFDNVNLPPSRRRGVELDGGWQALRVLKLTAGYAYLDARFQDGKTVPLVPRHKLNLGARWDLAPATQLTAMLSAVDRQVMENDEANTFPARIPGYAVLDMKLTHRAGGVRLSAAVNNLFDRKYYQYAVSSTVSDAYNVYPLPGRALALTAEVFLP